MATIGNFLEWKLLIKEKRKRCKKKESKKNKSIDYSSD